MFKRFFLNCRHPEGFLGRFMLSSMNYGHTAVSRWGLSHLSIRLSARVLDIGCGGGKNIERMLQKAKSGEVCGLDYSEASVQKSASLNRKAVADGRAEIKHGSVSSIPWSENTFDIVTAFETVYFWPDFTGDLKEVLRVLRPDGTLCICNELQRPEDGEMPAQYFVKTLDMKIYSQNELKQALAEAGFIDMKVVSGGKGNRWLCVLAKKPA